jgi:hypothetical protein
MILKTRLVDWSWSGDDRETQPAGIGLVDLASVSSIVPAYGDHTHLLLDGTWITIEENVIEVEPLWIKSLKDLSDFSVVSLDETPNVKMSLVERKQD